MSQDTILTTDTVRDALLTKVNGDFTEAFTNITEVTNARDSTVESTAYASLDARLEAIETALSLAIAGTSSVVSLNDAAGGVLNGKLVDDGVQLTENNDGGDETLSLSTPNAESIAFFNAIAF